MLFSPKNNTSTPHPDKAVYNQIAFDSIGFEDIKPGYNYHFFGDGKISLHDLVSKVLQQVGPSALYLLTWSISSPAMKALINMKEAGLITTSTAVVDYRAPKDHADAFSLARNFFDTLAISPNHSKIVVLDNSTMPVAITGSANLTRNPKQEYFMVCTDGELTRYFKSKIISMVETGERV